MYTRGTTLHRNNFIAGFGIDSSSPRPVARTSTSLTNVTSIQMVDPYISLAWQRSLDG